MAKRNVIVVLILVVWASVSCAQSLYFYPSSTTKKIIAHKYYVVSYSAEHKQSEWVAYMLTREQALSEKVERTNDFRVDPMVGKSSASAQLEDFKKSGYDRGHLAPAGDMKIDSVAMSESFYMTNMSPQLPDFNRGIWQRVEQQVRTWAQMDDTIYIATGPVLAYSIGTIGKSKVTIPQYYYKIVLDNKKPRAIAFLLENEKGGKKLRDYTVTIDSVEKLTGIDFFPILPDDLENRLESTLDTSLWVWNVTSEPRKYYTTEKKDYSEADITVKHSEAIYYIDQKVNVVGEVAQVSKTATSIYLNMGAAYPNQTFAGQIYADKAGAFGDLDSYIGKKISITGKIKEVNFKPMIVIESPEQIRMK